MNVKITRFDNSSGWVKGEVNNGEFTFEAQLFDAGSHYGINNGRVSKLGIYKGGEWIVNYDRGWDIEPRTEQHKNVLNEVVRFLETVKG